MSRQQPAKSESAVELDSGDRHARIRETTPWTAALDAAHRMAIDYLATLADSTVSRHASPEVMSSRFDLLLPESGCAPEDALIEWLDRAEPGIVRSPGPRYFGFVTGGVTPAALAGDWLASALDQNSWSWLTSPAAAQTELTVIRWLLDLFALPSTWSGALTSGATMANLCGLAAARQWAAQQLGFDASRDGLGSRPPIPVLGSTEVHHSALKALAILGFGRSSMQLLPAPGGAIELSAFDVALTAQKGPVIVVANAGEVNTGAFDNLRAMAELCTAHRPGAWLHVDGAFGLYAALSPARRHLLDGVDLADSVATDAHKWLNVPYDCGVAFVRERVWLQGAFAGSAAYLSSSTPNEAWDAHEHVPDISRRFRALAAWCTLRSSGRRGYREIVERSVINAQSFATWVAEQPELELLAPAHLNIVCFRLNPLTGDDETDDHINMRAVESIQRGGSAYVTGTRWNGHAAIRAAFDNWATDDADVVALEDAIVRTFPSAEGPPS